MQNTTEQLEPGEIRVTRTSPIMSENGDFELVAKHYSELHDTIFQHRFVWEFARTDAGEIEAYSFAWEPGHSEPITPEADLVAIGYVEQYLAHHGVTVNGMLSEGMYRPVDADGRFETDVGVEVE